MARLIEAPTKYTPEEWHRSNHLNYAKAEQNRKHGETIRDESARLANETDITTMKTQSHVNKKIEQRLNETTQCTPFYPKSRLTGPVAPKIPNFNHI